MGTEQVTAETAIWMEGRRTDHPIFVVGYMHSGTTLLRAILGAADGVLCIPGETRFFEHKASFRKRYADLSDPQTRTQFLTYMIELLGPEKSGSSVDHMDASMLPMAAREAPGTAFRHAMDAAASLTGHSRWLEKTPSHLFYIKDILEAIPDACIIEIVRDPRDVLASKKTRRETVWTTERYAADERPRKHLEKAYDACWDTFSWKAAVQAGTKAQASYPNRLRRVRYEDLVSNPASEVQTICDFLDLPFHPAMLKTQWRNAAGAVGRTEGIQADAVGRWSRVLKPAEVFVCQWLARDVMEDLGYEPATQIPKDLVAVPGLLVRSVGEFLLRLYRRWRQGGMAYLMHVVQGYLRKVQMLRRL